MTRKLPPVLKFIVGFIIGLLGANILKSITLKNGEPLCSLQSNIEKKFTYIKHLARVTPKILPSPTTNLTRKLLLVGVMTAQKYLDTRAQAIYQTWGRNVPGDIMFFSSEQSQSKSELPLVSLKGVDDSYPPQKKSFLMLKFIHDHYLNNYEYFMRADDDVYVKTDRLEELLRSVNSSKPQFIGQAGIGNKDEFGQLSLDPDENFCMGGPSMIFSHQTLQLMAPHVRYCLKHLYSTHEDVEVGRCVRKFAGIPCTWSYEMQTIFFHNFTGETATASRLRTKEIHRAITLHPIKIPENMFRLHKYNYGLQSQNLRYRTLELHRELKDVSILLKEEPNDWLQNYYPFANTSQLGLKPDLNKFVPANTQEILKWDFFTKSLYSYKNRNPKIRLNSAIQTSLEDITMEIMETINKFSKQRGRVIEFKDIYYGYYRVNPLYGVDFILDLLLTYKKYRGKKMTVPVRRHAYLQRTFTALEIKQLNIHENSQSAFKNDIHFIVPLYRRMNIFKRFLLNFESACLKNAEHVKLAVVLFLDGQDDQNNAKEAKDMVDFLRSQYLNYDLRLVETSGMFSRALALEIGAKLFPADSLLFFIDVDMVFDYLVLQRIRLNTIRGEKVYFPIVFSQFDPEFIDQTFEMPEDPMIINDNLGYWRQFGFGIVSLYHSDLLVVGGMDTSIEGWGKEDVDLYNKVVQSNLEIFRAPDPGLVHVFHPIICDPTLEAGQFEMCLGSKSTSMGKIENLAKDILKHYKEYIPGRK